MNHEKKFLLCIFSLVVIVLFNGSAFAVAVTDTRPANNALVNNPPAFLEAEFDDDVGLVSMVLDGVDVSAESHGSYILSNQSFENLSLGYHNVVTIVNDLSGSQIIVNRSFKLLPDDEFVTSKTLFANEPPGEVHSEDANTSIFASSHSDVRVFIAPVDEPSANPSLRKLGKFTEITASNSAVDFPVVIKIFYTDAEVSAAGIDESTMKIYFFNETGMSWQLEDSSIDVVNNFISAPLDHLSIYGVYGSAVPAPPPSGGSNNGGGGGSGGGSGSGAGGTTHNTTNNTTTPSSGSSDTSSTGSTSSQTNATNGQNAGETNQQGETGTQTENTMPYSGTATILIATIIILLIAVIAYLIWRRRRNKGK